MSQNLLYVTVGNADDGLRIGRTLVDERLAACANVIPGATSIYRWEGEVRTESEAILLLKTAAERVEPAIARIRELHEYACPCVLSFDIESGNPAFLEWIDRETSAAR